MLASAGDDGSIRLWEMENGKQVKTWNAHGGVQSLEFLRDGKLLTCGRDHQVKLWTADGKQQGPNLSLGELAMRAAATFDSRRVIAGDWAGEVRVWNAADGKQIGTLSADPPLLAQRLEIAQVHLAKRRADHERLVAASAASTEQRNKAVAELSDAQLAMKTADEAAKAAQSELTELQKSIEQLKGDANGLKTELANGRSAAETLDEAIAKAQQAAEKLPGDARLAESVTNLKSAAEGVAADLVATEKTLKEKTYSLSESEANLAGTQKRRQKSTDEVAAARQQSDALIDVAKTATEKAATDAKALEQSAQALESAQREADRWSDEMEFAKSAALSASN